MIFNALIKLPEADDVRQFTQEYSQVKDGYKNLFRTPAEELEFENLTMIFNALSRLPEGSPEFIDFVREVSRKRSDGLTTLQIMAKRCTPKELSTILTSLSRLPEGSPEFIDFIDECRKKGEDGRTNFQLIAEEGDIPSIVSTLHIIKKMPRDLHEFIKYCEKAVSAKDGKNVFQLIASIGSELDITLSMNSIYPDYVSTGNCTDVSLVKSAAKTLTLDKTGDRNKLIILEALARIEDSSSHEEQYGLRKLLSSKEILDLRRNSWKEYSHGSLEFDCPLEEIEERLPNLNKQQLSDIKQLVRVEIINRSIDFIEARSRKDKYSQAELDHFRERIFNTCALRTEINSLMKRGQPAMRDKKSFEQAADKSHKSQRPQSGVAGAQYQPQHVPPQYWAQYGQPQYVPMQYWAQYGQPQYGQQYGGQSWQEKHNASTYGASKAANADTFLPTFAAKTESLAGERAGKGDKSARPQSSVAGAQYQPQHVPPQHVPTQYWAQYGSPQYGQPQYGQQYGAQSWQEKHNASTYGASKSANADTFLPTFAAKTESLAGERAGKGSFPRL